MVNPKAPSNTAPPATVVVCPTLVVPDGIEPANIPLSPVLAALLANMRGKVAKEGAAYRHNNADIRRILGFILENIKCITNFIVNVMSRSKIAKLI